ncbi:hypothetical protein C7S20_19235 [Christiangramia fulva]|uniref:Tyr recombinase domain-containing protein n=2 Tax=Christiangramia fulva TaxID=2126553 RepID=A0A2R3ZAL7_9FLAO|nr:hypothetical protein C7S20_19235 [Christiangramia fulva]
MLYYAVSKYALNSVLLSPFLSPYYIWGMYFYLKNPKQNNETSIYLIHYLKDEGKNFKYSTGQKIQPNNWDFENRLPKTLRGSKGVKNRHIADILLQYAELLEEEIKKSEKENKPLTRAHLKDIFDRRFKNKKTATSFIDIVQLFIDTKNMSGGKSADWNQKYSNLKKKLELFEKYRGKKIQFRQINEDFIDAYSGFLRQIKNKPFKPHNDNTLHRNINFLFTFLIWSHGKYHNIDMDNLKNPVKKYQADDIHLTKEEVAALEEIELPRESLERVRDLFLIGVYSGQRYSDYSVFEKADVIGNMIIKRAEKTENESFIPLHPKLKRLLDKYDWNLPRLSDMKFRKHIKTICSMAGIDEEIKETIYRGNKKEVLYHKKHEMVSTHTARRTFITLAAEEGMPDHIIMKITGIRDPKTLQKYKKTSQRSVTEAMNRLMKKI